MSKFELPLKSDALYEVVFEAYHSYKVSIQEGGFDRWTEFDVHNLARVVAVLVMPSGVVLYPTIFEDVVNLFWALTNKCTPHSRKSLDELSSFKKLLLTIAKNGEIELKLPTED